MRKMVAVNFVAILCLAFRHDDAEAISELITYGNAESAPQNYTYTMIEMQSL